MGLSEMVPERPGLGPAQLLWAEHALPVPLELHQWQARPECSISSSRCFVICTFPLLACETHWAGVTIFFVCFPGE